MRQVRHLGILIGLALFAAALAAGAAQAGQYTVIDLGPLQAPSTIQVQRVYAGKCTVPVGYIADTCQRPTGAVGHTSEKRPFYLYYVNGPGQGKPQILQSLGPDGTGRALAITQPAVGLIVGTAEALIPNIGGTTLSFHATVWVDFGQPVDLEGADNPQFGTGLAEGVNEYWEVVGEAGLGVNNAQRALYACYPQSLPGAPACGQGAYLYRNVNGWYLYRLDVWTGAYPQGIFFTDAQQIDCRGNVAATGYVTSDPQRTPRSYLLVNDQSSQRSCL